jgi:hypothetical protein
MSAKRKRRLWDAYAFPGFRPLPTVRGVFGDPKTRVITLKRRSKKRSAAAADKCIGAGTSDARAGFAICPVAAYSGEDDRCFRLKVTADSGGR